MTVSKKALRQYIAGHVKANQIIARERVERLKNMSQEESAKIYDELCEIWQSNPPPDIDESTNIERKVSRRRKLDKAGVKNRS